jgi:hypothetical protein
MVAGAGDYVITGGVDFQVRPSAVALCHDGAYMGMHGIVWSVQLACMHQHVAAGRSDRALIQQAE